MATSVSNDLNSPVSLLWAHQLRKEHAVLVAQLEELKELRLSASELKKLAAQTEKAEASTKSIRKELVELKTAHSKSVKLIEALEKSLQEKDSTRVADVTAREKQEQSLCLQIERLGELLTRHQDEMASTADELWRVRRQAEEGNAAAEQKLLQKDDEIAELKRLIQMLEQKIDDAVTVVKDSVECSKIRGESFLAIVTGKPLEAPMAAPEVVSEADSFDLDANVAVATAAAAPEPALGPSLAMIAEPTLPRSSQRLRNERVTSPSTARSMELLEEPSLPPQPPHRKHNAASAAKRVNQPTLNLLQGKLTLSAYMQTADARYQEVAPSNEKDFVNAFVHGLRDKRDKKKCDKKFTGSARTWENVKECFPIASQHSQSHGGLVKDVGGDRKRKRGRVDDMESGERPNVTPPPLPPSTKKRRDVEEKKNQEGKGDRSNPPTTLNATRKKNQVEKNDQKAETRAWIPRTPFQTEKRSLLEQQTNQKVEIQPVAIPPRIEKAGTKKKKDVREKRRQRAPSIPILPSSDDEYS